MWIRDNYWHMSSILITIALGIIIGIFVYQVFLSESPAVPLVTYHRDLDMHNEIHYCDTMEEVGFWYINSSNIIRMTAKEYAHFCVELHGHD